MILRIAVFSINIKTISLEYQIDVAALPFLSKKKYLKLSAIFKTLFAELLVAI